MAALGAAAPLAKCTPNPSPVPSLFPLTGVSFRPILQMGEAFGYAISTQWPDAPGWLWERSGEAGGRKAMSGGKLMRCGGWERKAQHVSLLPPLASMLLPLQTGPSNCCLLAGTAAMLFFTLAVIFPLSMLPRMRHVSGTDTAG